MKLKELQEWIESLPKEFLEFEVVSSEVGELVEGETNYRLDQSIMALDVSEESEEILLLTTKP